MKNIGIAILIAVGTIFLEWMWLGICQSFFSGMSMETATIAGVGFFLAAELVICTGIILAKLDKK